ncbi:uncharacterized protein ATNIH1004_006236 [Aspergillus tanneri]|uniref:Uncharacterized protein n=1 Tax=Aspergillus tanneri TaxID=1220188 RepID=A0A5M9MKL6_9EURO|nr:uncharacterized protein ATNIH1004_006236 [Aspergillus tanneri]KAA8647542.1 hypothetical protein ATNIH1004_006236 [Aspergillus tanneri]
MSLVIPDSPTRILRFSRSDKPKSFVLLHVARTGSVPLDLDIVATEGENPYTGTVRQVHLKELRAKNYQGSDEEWPHVVSHVFGQLSESAEHLRLSSLSGIEAMASITRSGDQAKELVITVRKRIEGITQRLGSVVLRRNDEQEIQLYDWSAMTVSRADAIEQRCHLLWDRCSAAENMVNQLRNQIEQLVKAKVHHEEQVMANVVHLLNEKKLKIRNQRRLLDSAKLDHPKVFKYGRATPDNHQAYNEKSMSRKHNSRETSDSESENEDAFERVEVDPHAYGGNSIEMDKGINNEHSSYSQALKETGDNTTDGKLSAIRSQSIKGNNGKMKQHVNTKSSLEHISMNASTAPPQVISGIQNQKSTQSNDYFTETAGETDDDEL